MFSLKFCSFPFSLRPFLKIETILLYQTEQRLSMLSDRHAKLAWTLIKKQKPPTSLFNDVGGFSHGAPGRDRTGDLRVTNALLCQLSHGSISGAAFRRPIYIYLIIS